MIGLLKKPLMKRGTGAVCALGILLGAQIAAFAIDSTDIGWRLGADCYQVSGGDIKQTASCLVWACQTRYAGDKANSNGCIEGGTNEVLTGPFGPGGSGISTP